MELPPTLVHRLGNFSGLVSVDDELVRGQVPERGVGSGPHSRKFLLQGIGRCNGFGFSNAAACRSTALWQRSRFAGTVGRAQEAECNRPKRNRGDTMKRAFLSGVAGMLRFTITALVVAATLYSVGTDEAQQ